MATTLHLGARVRWTSQSGGYEAEKEGTVVYLGPVIYGGVGMNGQGFGRLRTRHCTPEFLEMLTAPGYPLQRFKHRGDYVTGTGVIVLVTRESTRGKPLKPWTYTPRKCHLVVVEVAEDFDDDQLPLDIEPVEMP